MANITTEEYSTAPRFIEDKYPCLSEAGQKEIEKILDAKFKAGIKYNSKGANPRPPAKIQVTQDEFDLYQLHPDVVSMYKLSGPEGQQIEAGVLDGSTSLTYKTATLEVKK